MSAFMCPDEVFAQLARFLTEDRPDLLSVKHADLNLTPVEFVECLRAANYHSVQYRYPDEKPDANGMLAPKLDSIDPRSVHPCTAAQARKHLECIEYQSCEDSKRWVPLRPLVEAMANDIYPLKRDRHGCAMDQTYIDAQWGRASAKPPPEPEPIPAAVAGAKERVMRATTLIALLKEPDRCTVFESYSYDDCTGQSRLKQPRPAHYLAPGGEYEKRDHYNIRPFEIEGSTIRAVDTVNGGMRVHVRVHSNSNFDIYVAPKAKGAKRAA